MYKATYQIAGAVIQIDSLYELIHDYCKDYRVDGQADFFVSIKEEDIAFEREKSDRENELEGLPKQDFSDAYLETLAVYRKIADRMLKRDTLLFHGSAIAVDGRAVLFTAKSGTGKSTHTRLWRQVFGDRAVMVNDDKPFLKLTETGVLACGSPWSGKHGLDTNITVPLQGICILERGRENQIHRISPEEALPMLLHQSYCPLEPEKGARFEERVRLLAETVPLWHMYCNMDPSAAEVSHKAMSK